MHDIEQDFEWLRHYNIGVAGNDALDRIQAEVERLQGQVKSLLETCGHLSNQANAAEAEVKRLRDMHDSAAAKALENASEVERLRAALERAGDRLAQVQPGVTEPWAFDIVPKAEQEIAEVLNAK